MWLLNASSGKLEYFNSEHEAPNGYAILSHTWGSEEVAFDEIHSSRSCHKAGYEKIKYSRVQTLQDGLNYIWIDTCEYV